ncbi:heavy metal-associated isoprenylated plant protein 3-like [Magnolia sinica]|uniref:heavy metal-associated isoprenylated plant protein 3-like n=1 Tax=Magnolia sinica TaxID=86752 RepID=UPI00265A3DED|nr:heavy metal-associated isoprenylated plant protein 3-like [Magnolia sinica]
MGEKDGEKKGEEKKGDGGKKEDGAITVVLKVDMHCDGCAKKIIKSVKGFDGVENVKADHSSNKLTVVGKVDPEKIRSRVESKTKKKVELVSPAPKKDKDGGEKKPQNKPEKAEDKKGKEPVSSTVVLKIRLHCEGCIKKIQRIIRKIKGVENVSIDSQKDLVTVKGTMDAKALPSYLKEKLKRNVEVVPPKKDGGDGGDKKAKEGGGGGGEKKDKADGGGEKKDKAGGGEKKDKEGGGGGEQAKVEMNKMEYGGNGYWANPPWYAAEPVHAPQIFSDENPNACSVM